MIPFEEALDDLVKQHQDAGEEDRDALITALELMIYRLKEDE